MSRSVFAAERHFVFGEERSVEKFTLRVASSKAGRSEIAQWLKKHSRA
jgi:hypothetical protein